MILGTLTAAELGERLRGPGVVLRTGPFLLRLMTPLRELVAPLALLYRDFPLADDEPILDFTVRIAPSFSPLGWLGWRAATRIDGSRAFDPYPRRQALAMLEWSVNWCVFTRPNQYLLLHSAVVEREGRALLLPGRPGSGKSTLAAALALRGWRLLSDEVAMVRPGPQDLVPVPRPVALKEGSIDAIRRFEPRATLGPECSGTRKGTVAHLRPPGDCVARAGEPTSPRWIVFPHFAADGGAALRPLPRTDALLRIADESFNYSLLGAVGFETLAAVVERCSCHELRFAGLDEGLALLDQATA